MMQDIKNRIFLNVCILIISLIEFIVCVITRHAVLFVTIEEMFLILSFIILGVYLFKNNKKALINIIIPFILYLSIYVIALVRIFPYFINTIKFGVNYYVTLYHYPGILTIDRILENITFSRIAEHISIYISQYLVSLIVMLLDVLIYIIFVLIKEKKNRYETKNNY